MAWKNRNWRRGRNWQKVYYRNDVVTLSRADLEFTIAGVWFAPPGIPAPKTNEPVGPLWSLLGRVNKRPPG